MGPKLKNGQLESQEQSFSSLIEVFDAVDVHEKGIEKVYDYLLKHEIIEDPKTIFEELDLSLKRVYKILSVLKDLNLVQVYDRPMKIILNNPINAWETLISERINVIKQQTNEKIQLCENSFKLLMEAYHLETDKPALPPLEFISLTEEDDPIEYIQSELTAEKDVLISKDMRFEVKFFEKARDIFTNQKRIQQFGYKDFKELIHKWLLKLGNTKYKILLSEEFVEETLQKQFQQQIPDEIINQAEIFFVSNIEIRIINDPVGNFLIKDKKELWQYSVDPSNFLLGIFISRQQEIIDIFEQKFEMFYEKATNISEYFQGKFNRNPTDQEKITLSFY